MDQALAQKAISSALKGNWSESVETNKALLVENPEDVDALNRLARAYAELGNLRNAKITANKVLKIDPYNSIATKSIAKWKSANGATPSATAVLDPNMFIEEPGKTKVIPLLHLGGKSVIDSLVFGQEVCMHTQGHRVSICANDGKYIGRLADDLSTHIKNLIKCGNEYRCFIKSMSDKSVSVFIKETVRDESVADIPSFSGDKMDYVSFTPPELVRGKEPVFSTDDDED